MMKKLFGATLLFCLLGLTLSANEFENRSAHVFSNCDTVDFDTLEIVEEIVVDTVGDDYYLLCDTIVENDEMIDITTEDITPFSQLGESSASLYANRQFSYTNKFGSEFEFVVNADGVSGTLTRGDAKGASKLIIPSTVEGLDSYFFVTDIAQDAFETFFKTPMKGVKELEICEGIQNVGKYCFKNAMELESVSLPASLNNLSFASSTC